MQLLSCTIIYSNSIQRLSQQWVNTMNSGTAGENKEAEKRRERERERERESGRAQLLLTEELWNSSRTPVHSHSGERERKKKSPLAQFTMEKVAKPQRTQHGWYGTLRVTQLARLSECVQSHLGENKANRAPKTRPTTIAACCLSVV